MSDINEVRARLERAVAELHGSRIAIDVGALPDAEQVLAQRDKARAMQPTKGNEGKL